MRVGRSVVLCALVGAAIPISSILAAIFTPAVVDAVMSRAWSAQIFLMACPGCLLFLGDPEGISFVIPALAILANVSLYAAVIGLILFGIRRSKYVLIGVLSAVVTGWVFLWTLISG